MNGRSTRFIPISAAFATLAGALLALWLRYNGPDTSLSFEIMINILLIVLILVTYIMFPSISKQVGSDIILAISISELLLNIHWMSHGVYYYLKSENPTSRDPFCEISYTIAVFGIGGEYIYNLLFGIFVYQKKYGAQRKYKYLQPRIYHSVIIGSVSLIYILLILFKYLGLNFQATCSIKGDAYQSIVILPSPPIQQRWARPKLPSWCGGLPPECNLPPIHGYLRQAWFSPPSYLNRAIGSRSDCATFS